MSQKQVHFRVERQLWYEFKKVFPYRGEPAAFFTRCMIAAIKHERRKIDDSSVLDIIKEVESG